MIRVCIADDHRLVRDGLRRTLSAPDIAVTGEAADGARALAVLDESPADVLLLDVAMPGRPFLELLREVRQRFPALRVVVLSAHGEEQYAVRALRAGASAYLTKERSPEELIEAIRRVAAGGRYVSATLAELLAAELGRDTGQAGHAALSDREFQVLRLIGAGRSVKEISAELGLSSKTVSTYRARMLEKLSARTTADLIRYAIAHGLT